MQEDVLLVGPFGDSIAWEDEPNAVLVGEVDGARQITSERHLLIRKVPEAVVDVFQTGSTAAGTLLCIFPKKKGGCIWILLTLWSG